MRLIISKGLRRGQVRVAKRDGEGREVATESSAFVASKHFREVARSIRVDVEVFRDAVVQVRDGESEEVEIDLTPPVEVFRVRVRGLREPASAAIEFAHTEPIEALRLALSYVGHPAGEPVIEWTGTDQLAAVDVDYHRIDYANRLNAGQAYARMGTIEPRAVACWQTHGRGLRLLYAPRAGYTAGELAAVAALAIASRDPAARVELKPETRHPAYTRGEQRCGEVVWQTPDADIGAVRGWLQRRAADSAQVAEWLEARRFEVGRRYSHDRCPVRPEDGGERNPVQVCEDGILCHACRGRGVTYGSRLPGWFPFHALAGAVVETNLATCLEHFTHWGHARYVVEAATGLAGEVGRLAYSAALRMLHGEELAPTIEAIFRVESRTIRQRGFWSTPSGEALAGDIRGMLATLPTVATYPGGPAAGVARLSMPIDLSREGYPALTPVWGVQVYGEYLSHTNPATIPIVVQTPDLDPDYATRFRPRYRLRANRMPIEDAWQTIEAICPGVNRAYVELLIAARGCYEGEIGLTPMIFVSGPSGAAKTGTAHLAAAILGDRCTENSWNPSLDRFRQQLQYSKERGSFCLFNEFLKGASEAGTDPVPAMDRALNFTHDSTSHKLFVGSVSLGTPPVVVWTDTHLPDAIRQSQQLARRIVGVHLSTALDWKDRLTAAGVSRIGLLRLTDPQWCDAADAILSNVIDRYFTWPTEFQVIARSLGFKTLAESEEAEEGREQLRSFFRAVCQSPGLSGALAKRFSGKGWIELPRFGEGELTIAWRVIANADGTSSRRCSEVDWCKLLGVQGSPVKFETKTHGAVVVCRFIQATNRSTYRTNGEIVGTASTVPESDDWRQIDWSCLEGVEV